MRNSDRFAFELKFHGASKHQFLRILLFCDCLSIFLSIVYLQRVILRQQNQQRLILLDCELDPKNINGIVVERQISDIFFKILVFHFGVLL